MKSINHNIYSIYVLIERTKNCCVFSYHADNVHVIGNKVITLRWVILGCITKQFFFDQSRIATYNLFVIRA